MADTGGEDQASRPAGVPSGRVRRRRVFYVGGFDPASPKKYHRLYSEHAPRQGGLTGVRYRIGALEARDEISSGWSVTADTPEGAHVEVDYVFLHWFDLVRANWPKDGVGLLAAAIRALGDYYRWGVMALAEKEAPVVAVASRMPAIIGGAFVGLVALLVAAASLVGALLAVHGGRSWLLGALPPLIFLLLAPPLWGLFDSWLPVGWIGRGMIAVTRGARGEIPALGERARQFAGRIGAAAADPAWDEVLVVAHSMGGQLACAAVGRAAAQDPAFGRAAPVALLTLGSLLPFHSMIAQDDAEYRADMAALVAAAQVPWIDVTSPGDPGSSAAMHTLAGLDLGQPKDRPVRLSPRFHAILEPGRYRALKKRPLELHFQYIRSGDVAEGYDFFRLTAGPEPLAQAVRRMAAPAEKAPVP